MLDILPTSKTESQITKTDVKQQIQEGITFMYVASFVPMVDGRTGI